MARGRIIIDLFTTLDGVAQAPGSPDEDPSGGFRFGGWQAPIPDSLVGEQVMAYIDRLDALLLGRRTYDIFAAYWPHHTEGGAGVIGRTFNRVPKYVASRSVLEPAWEGTTQLGADVVAEVDALRDRHDEIHLVGSVNFVQTLLAAGVFDELKLWVHPVVLGEGKKVFPDGDPRQAAADRARAHRRRRGRAAALRPRRRAGDGHHGRVTRRRQPKIIGTSSSSPPPKSRSTTTGT